MSNGWNHERFKDYVLRCAANVGIETTTELARATDLKPGMLSKWFRGLEQPTSGSLRKLAGPIGAPLPDLLVLAGRAGAGELNLDAAPELPDALGHPLAREIDRMLRADSPIRAADRDALETLLDRVIDPYRRTMRRRRPA